MATYNKLTVNNGFVKSTKASASVTIGAHVKLTVQMKVHAKTVSDVYNQLTKMKSSFSSETWEKIQQSHVGGGASFFFGLFDLMAGISYDYYNRETNTNIQNNQQLKPLLRPFIILILQM